MPAHPERLVLASASPRRRELLERIGLRFEVYPANVEEDDSGDFGPERLVADNAAIKADALTKDFPDALVLGSDTTVALGDRILAKPADFEEAVSMLEKLSGRTHTVYTAVALRWKKGGVDIDFVEQSQVRFKKLDRILIERYFQRVDPMDKAGAYGIQEAREMIIDSVEGSVENVMGLPVQALKQRLAEHKFDFKV